MTMIRRPLLLLALILPAPVAAQQVVRMAPNVDLTVWYPAPWTLAAFPTWWRDSVRSAFTHAIKVGPNAVSPEPTQGSAATLSLQVLRSGAIHKVRLDPGTGNASIDSALVRAARDAGAAGAFPAFPPGVDGAGREVRLVAYLPITKRNRPEPRPDQPEARWQGGYVAPPLSASCDSAIIAHVQWHQAVIGVGVDSTSGGDGMDAWGSRALQSLTEVFVAPARVSTAHPPSVFNERPGGPLFSGTVHLVITSTGKIRSMQLLVATGVPEFDSSLVAMFARADSQEVIPPPTSTRGDTASLDVAVWVTHNRIPTEVILGPITVGEWSLETAPALRKIGPMRYPRNLRDRNVSGRVAMAFVVQPDGNADLSTLVIRSSADPAFSQASLDLLKGARYTPGTIAGCPVPVIVQQAVNFSPLVRRDVVTTRP